MPVLDNNLQLPPPGYVGLNKGSSLRQTTDPHWMKGSVSENPIAVKKSGGRGFFPVHYTRKNEGLI